MIKLKAFWIVECDECEELLSTNPDIDYEVWHSENDAKEALGDGAEWVEEDGKVYCESCYDVRTDKDEQ